MQNIPVVLVVVVKMEANHSAGLHRNRKAPGEIIQGIDTQSYFEGVLSTMKACHAQYALKTWEHVRSCVCSTCYC